MKKQTPIDQTSAEYKNMLDLQSVHAAANNDLKELEAEINDEMLTQIDFRRDRYAQLQKAIADSEASLELIAVQHPQWFGDKKSLKTLYGSLEFKSSRSLEVANAELSLALIEAEAIRNGDFDPILYTRREITLNLEALGELDDATLAKFKIKRVEKNNFTVKPAKVDLGKAVKEAAERQAS